MVAVVDTNSNPDTVDHVIPGNDDALRAIRLFTNKMADAVIEGRGLATAEEFEPAEGVEGEVPEGEVGSRKGGSCGAHRDAAPLLTFPPTEAPAAESSPSFSFLPTRRQ